MRFRAARTSDPLCEAGGGEGVQLIGGCVMTTSQDKVNADAKPSLASALVPFTCFVEPAYLHTCSFRMVRCAEGLRHPSPEGILQGFWQLERLVFLCVFLYKAELLRRVKRGVLLVLHEV